VRGTVENWSLIRGPSGKKVVLLDWGGLKKYTQNEGKVKQKLEEVCEKWKLERVNGGKGGNCLQLSGCQSGEKGGPRGLEKGLMKGE